MKLIVKHDLYHDINMKVGLTPDEHNECYEHFERMSVEAENLGLILKFYRRYGDYVCWLPIQVITADEFTINTLLYHWLAAFDYKLEFDYSEEHSELVFDLSEAQETFERDSLN